MKLITLTLMTIVSSLLVTFVNVPSPTANIYAQQILKRSPWQQFSSPVGKFTISMPGKPIQESNTDSDGSVTHNFTVVSGETVYLVTYSDLVAEVERVKPSDIFDAVCKGYIADGDKLVNQREIQLGGYPGRSVDLKATDGMNGKANIYLIGNRLYQLLLLSSELEDGKQFFDSFQVTEKNSK